MILGAQVRRVFLPLVATLSVGCVTDDTEPMAAAQSASHPEPSATPLERDGTARVVASWVDPSAARVDTPATADASPLEDAASGRLLARLPELPAAKSEFRLPPRALTPPPVVPEQVQDFAPSPSAPEEAVAPEGSVEVQRITPVGEVEIALDVQVQFDRPMVDLSAAPPEPQLALEPAVEGRWRWVEPRTAVFEPKAGRLPGATRFTVTVPAGTAAADGSLVEGPVRSELSTPPPSLRSISPHDGADGVDRQPILLLRFDQRVNEAEIDRGLRLSAGGQRFALRAPSETELAARPDLERQLEGEDGEFLLARIPAAPLPTGTELELELPAGPWSAEGPLPSEKGFESHFEVYGPLKVVGHDCGWGSDCRPGMPLRVQLSNDLAETQTAAPIATLEPELPGVDIRVRGRSIEVVGATEAERRYTLRLSADLLDRFGQRLGETEPQSFEIDGAEPMMAIPGGGDLVRRLPGDPTLPVLSAGTDGLQVKIHRVAASDWPAFTRNGRESPPLPGTSVFDGRLPTAAGPAQIGTTAIDLSKALTEGRGHVALEISAPVGYRGRTRTEQVWVQVSDVLVDVFTDDTRMWVMVTDPAGAPLAGREVSLQPSGPKARTDADGRAELELPTKSPGERPWVEVEGGGFMPEGRWSRGHGFVRSGRVKHSLTGLALDDRGIYRPGEKARIFGFVRMFEAGEGLRAAKNVELSYIARDPRRKTWAEGRLPVDAHGRFELEIDIPDNANIGQGLVEFRAASESTQGHFHRRIDVADFRRPTAELQLGLEPEPPHVVGRALEAALEARAFAGGPVAEAPVKLELRLGEASFAPAGWDGFSFGRSRPWWWRSLPFGHRPAPPLDVLSGRTASDGRARARIEPRGLEAPFPASLEVSAELEGPDGRPVSASARTTLHPAALTVGLRAAKTFLPAGASAEIEVVMTDLEGAARAGQVKLSLHPAPGLGMNLDEVKPPLLETELVTAEGPTPTTMKPPVGGRFVLRAEVEDERGRSSRSELILYWSGRPADVPETLETESLELVPDAETYAPGDTALLHIRSPLETAQGLALISGPLKTDAVSVKIEGGAAELRFPVPAGTGPRFPVQVWVAGGTEARPRSAEGRVEIQVFPKQDVLQVSVEPEPLAEPGAETSLALRVLDANGKPAAKVAVTLAVVDEAVLAVAGEHAQWPDPLSVLRPGYGYRGRTWSARPQLLVMRPSLAQAAPPVAEEASLMSFGATADAMPAPKGKRMARSAAPEPANDAIDLREDMRALAHFTTAVVTDEQGRAKVQFRLPDSLTRFRARAVATDGGASFGRGEASLSVRKPVSIEPALPRFLSLGDQVELPFVVRNQSGEAMEVNVAVQVSGAELTGARGLRLTVPNGSTRLVHFPARVRQAGEVVVQAGLSAGRFSDAARVRLPSLVPVVTQSFAEYGSLERDPIGRGIEALEGLEPAAGGLDLMVASTALLPAHRAIEVLAERRLSSTESRASRVIGLSPFVGREGVPAIDRAQLSGDVEAIIGARRPDGSWGWWPQARRPSPLVSVHAVHALLRAREADLGTDADLGQGIERLKDLEPLFHPDSSDAYRAPIRAYAGWVLAAAGTPIDKSQIDRWVRDGGGANEASADLLGWAIGAAQWSGHDGLAQRLQTALSNRVSVTAAAAHVVSAATAGSRNLLWSSSRADALLLMALVERSPRAGLVEQMLRGLMDAVPPDHRPGAELCWRLLAAARYLAAKESTAPDLEARAWLGDQLVLDASLEGRGAVPASTRVPMGWMLEHPSKRRLVLAAEGKGRLYYRFGIEAAPANHEAPAEARGFVVQRRYEAMDEPSDVQRTDEEWTIRRGARVRVVLEVVARGPRAHVALVDRLPAGLEPEHLQSPSFPWLEGDHWGFRFWSWDHRGLRDEGGEAHAVDLAPGLHRFVYVARATVPGRFVAGPARAEEAYAPETYGRTATDVVRVVTE